MKNERLLDIIGEVDESLIQEAEMLKPAAPGWGFRFRPWMGVAVAAVLVFAVGLRVSGVLQEKSSSSMDAANGMQEIMEASTETAAEAAAEPAEVTEEGAEEVDEDVAVEEAADEAIAEDDYAKGAEIAKTEDAFDIDEDDAIEEAEEETQMVTLMADLKGGLAYIFADGVDEDVKVFFRSSENDKWKEIPAGDGHISQDTAGEYKFVRGEEEYIVIWE